MYLLDTNVVSELRKTKTGKANRRVEAWAKEVSTSTLFLSAITILELEVGILLLERRDQSQGALLRVWLEHSVLPAFDGRILAVDTLSRADPPQCTSRSAAPLETP
jgi:toxin FitB